MNFSLKSFLVSFLVFLVVFALVLGLVFRGIFKSTVSVAKNEIVSSAPAAENQPREIMIFCDGEAEAHSFRLAVIAIATAKEVRLLPLYGTYLLEEKNAYYYISSRIAEEGTGMLCQVVECIVGQNVNLDAIVNLSGQEMSVFDTLSGNFPARFGCYFSTDIASASVYIDSLEFKTVDNFQIIDFSKCLSKFSK